MENVLQGQYKERKTRRLDRTEDTLFSSSETETTKERDVQTTSKNELQQQAKEVIDKEQKLEAGVKVSATYGPVSVEASFGYGSTMSQNQTNEKSLTIAKSITDRALERVVNKVHEERTSRKISEFEEINTHGLDNRGGTGHVVGVYRWLTKVYRAKLVSYGLRDSIECIIENPAEFLRPKAGGTELENTGWWALDSQNHKDVSLKTPLKTAGDLDENNYVYYSSYYGVELEPPPQMILTLAKAYGEGSVPNEVLATPNNDVMIPEGYYALYAYVRGGFHQPPGFPGNVTVFIGNQTFGLGAASGYLIPNLYNNVGVSLVGWTRGYSLEVTFWCVRTTAHFESWQLKSYKRLKDAYNAKLMQLEQAAQNANGIIGSMGTNPSRNVEIIEQELKKCVISALLCNQAFWLGCEKRVVECSCSSTGDSVPLPGHHKRTCEIGHLATFIESVIDWKLMVYELYSYFYANTCEWKTLKSFAADDPLFEKFLQAGLARVVVPLAVGKEQDFYHFYTTGQVWKLFTPPPILGGYEDQTIASDVLDSQHNPITWEVRVPTSLVILECGSGCVSNPGPTDPSYPYFAPIIGSHEGGSLVGGSGKEEDGGKEEPHVH